MAAAAAAVNCTAADMKLAVFDVATTTAAAPRRPGCYRRCELITFRWTRAQTLSTVGENLGTIDFIPYSSNATITFCYLSPRLTLV